MSYTLNGVVDNVSLQVQHTVKKTFSYEVAFYLALLLVVSKNLKKKTETWTNCLDSQIQQKSA